MCQVISIFWVFKVICMNVTDPKDFSLYFIAISNFRVSVEISE